MTGLICPLTNKKPENSYRFYGCRCSICDKYWKHREYRDLKRDYSRLVRKRPGSKAKEKGFMIKWRYGITFEEYNEMRLKQEYKCKICGKEEIEGHRLDIDHNHRTNKVRGLLCQQCNAGLGHYVDRPDLLRKAAEYLETSEPVQESITKGEMK